MDREYTEKEWAHTFAQMKKPIIANYMVFPHVPDDVPTLLSPAGEPFMLDYCDLNFRKLADDLQELAQTENLPKSIKVYVGNDAADLFDINQVDYDTGEVDEGYSCFDAAYDVYAATQISDFRAGIAKIRDSDSDLHLNPPTLGKRPPVSALFVSIRFASASQLADYMTTASKAILGLSDYPGLRHEDQGILGTRIMLRPLAQWLQDEAGAVYGDHCTVIRLPLTLTQK